MRLTQTSCCLVPLLFLICIAGCGESSNDVSVQGRVSYRGETIGKGAATFYPVNGRPVTAALSDAGEYSIELPPGEYTVTVNVGTQLPPGFKEGDPSPRPKFVLPPEYTTRARSKLTATVSENLSEPINFELK